MSHKKAKPGKTLFDYFTVKQNTENLNPNNIKPEPKMDVEEGALKIQFMNDYMRFIT